MSWPKFPFSEVFTDASGGNIKTPQKEFLEHGEIPVVDQGQKLIAGYVNDKKRICNAELPVIIFGDHTRALKFVDFQFAMGADGTKVLVPKLDADSKFLFYALTAQEISPAGYSRHFKFLKELEIPLPPIEEQKRIAGILDAADELRTKRRESLAQLDALLQSTFLDMFGDPVTNPKGWAIDSLINHGSLKNGLNYTKSEKGFDLACLGVGNFKSLSRLDDVNKLPVLSLDSLPSSEYLLKDGDLVFVRSNGNKELVGRCLSIHPGETPVTFSGFCIRYRIESSKILPTYLSHLFRTGSVKSALLRRGQGANIQNINQKILSSLFIPIPPVDVQRLFVSFLDSVEQQKTRAQAQLTELDTLFASLQSRAFRGEL